MRKALILAYDFPPLNSIGAQRPYSWFKYFKAFGIEPIVVTRHWDRKFNDQTDFYRASLSQHTVVEESTNGTVIRVPFKPNLRDRLIDRSGAVSVILRKFLSLAQALTEHHTSNLDNKCGILNEARKYLQSNKVDIIIATGEPFILFSYAARLSKKFDIPWVADYRDGWSTNNNLEQPSFRNRLFKKVFGYVERSTLYSSSIVSTAAPDFSKRISSLLGKNEHEVPVIYNGYFEELYENLEPVKLQNVFSIAHAGTIYPFQKVETFLDGLNRFLSKHPQNKIEVTFYGLNMFPEQIKRIQNFPTEAKIQFTDKMPHRDIIQKLRSTHVQLLLATPEVNQIYAKVFDYMATGRPILTVENDKGPLEEMLTGRSNSRLCSSAEEVCSYLEYAYGNRELEETYPSEDNTFTRRNQTKRFAELILQTIEKKERS